MRNSRTAKLAGVAVAVAVVAAVAIGGNYLWNRRFGPTPASQADCQLAQELFDKAQSAPADPTKSDAWEQQIREIRYAQMKDEGLSTQVGKYAHWAAVKASGAGDKPTAKKVDDAVSQAQGHCRQSGVSLVIPPLNF